MRRIIPIFFVKKPTSILNLISFHNHLPIGLFASELPYFFNYLINQNYSNLYSYFNNVLSFVPVLKHMHDQYLKASNHMYSFIETYIVSLNNSFIPLFHITSLIRVIIVSCLFTHFI